MSLHSLYRIYSLEVEKRGLSAYDNKRYLLADGVHTLAFGHRDIPKGEIEVGKAPLFDDEHIMARLAVDRKLTSPPAHATRPTSDLSLPDDSSDYVVFASLHPELAVPTLPGLRAEDFELMKMGVTKALHNGRDEGIVGERVRNCFNCIADADSFLQRVFAI